MASVTTETRNGRTRYRIEWRDGDKRRHKMRLPSGLNNRKDADVIARKVTAIVSASISKRTLDNAVVEWLTEIDDDLHARLAGAGLVDARQSTKLDEFLASYVEGRKSEVESRTITSLEATRKKLTQHFGESQSLRSINEGDAHEWRQSLFTSLSPTTIAGHVKRAKQFFGHAKRKRLIDQNPFIELVAGSQANDSRKMFIEREIIDLVIEHAPTAQWKLLIALARYGGLRNPSETLRLRWQDIDRANNRILITSPKTARTKPTRVIPLFPELESYIADAYDVAPDGSVYCIEFARSQDVNLRKGLQSIIAKAKVNSWPRLWQNLRASRETELANEYPIHVVTEWIGNSPRVAAQHYLTVTDAHFAQATTGVGRKVGTSLPESTDLAGNNSQPVNDKTQRKQGNLEIIGASASERVGRAGLEPATKGL